MSDKKTVIPRYQDIDVFFKNGKKVNELIEADTGKPVAQTRSLPPSLMPVELSQSTIDRLEAIAGVDVQNSE